MNCTQCNKEIMVKSLCSEEGLVIKSRLVFLGENGTVKAKCNYCKKIIDIPIKYING